MFAVTPLESHDVPTVDEEMDNIIQSLVESMQTRFTLSNLFPARPVPNAPAEKNRVISPSWARQSAAIQRVEEHARATFHDNNSTTLTYFLPPVTLFFSGVETSTIITQKVHNWLRLRLWCFDQIRTRERVLMSTKHWRIALEGAYYSIPYDHLKLKAEIGVSPEEIQRLPPTPPDTKHRQLSEDPVRKNKTTTQHKRVADRIAINVRFGVYGGFRPYDPLVKQDWGKSEWDAKSISASGERILSEVVWELSVASFRLELMDIDRALLTTVYGYPDSSLAARRESQICQIWNYGWVRPAWENGERDPLSSDDWTIRVRSLKQLAAVVSCWPDGSRFKKYALTSDMVMNEKAALELEYCVFLFYAETFHRLRGRRPILPRLQPATMVASGSVS